MEENQNHIGERSWRRLSKKQKRAIIKDRKNGRKLYDGFSKERLKRLYPERKDLT